MEVDFTLWSLQDILKQIPFNTPVAENGIALDFSKINAPDYVKTNFKVIFIYDKTDNAPYDASCSIYSPNTFPIFGYQSLALLFFSVARILTSCLRSSAEIF
jgi:hypothetical protein